MPGTNLAGSGQALDQSLPTIITGFKLLRDWDGLMRRLATPMRLEPHTGSTKEILNYGRATAYVVGDGVDVQQAQDLSDARTSITPNEVAVQIVLAGSTIRRVADPALLRRVGMILENAYDLKEDQDGCTQLDSFTTSRGAAATVLNPGLHMSAVTGLQTGNSIATPEPAPEPHYAVYHPCSLHALLGRIVPLSDVPTGTNVYTGAAAGATVGPGRTAMGDDVLRRGWRAVGTLGGIPVHRDANIQPDSNDDAKGAVFSREGLIYLSEVEPKLEDERDKSLRGGVELTYWGSYGWQNFRAAAYGVEIISDAALPTA